MTKSIIKYAFNKNKNKKHSAETLEDFLEQIKSIRVPYHSNHARAPHSVQSLELKIDGPQIMHFFPSSVHCPLCLQNNLNISDMN